MYQEYSPIPGFQGPYPPHIVKQYEGIDFVCLFQPPNKGHDYLNMSFNQHAVSADLRVYFVTSLCYPQVINPSVSISHGVFWDFPQHPFRRMSEEQRRDWMKAQMIGFTLPDHVISVDHNVPNVIRSFDPGSDCRIRTIPNYADTKKFVPKEKDWEGIRVLFPRRSTLVRGWNLFSAAARQLPDYEFIACGDANRQEDQDDLERNVTRLTPNLKQTHVHMNNMVEMYQNVDIVCIPTLGAEGTSLSLIEAMSCGKPVISTAVGGLSQLVTHGYNGLIFNPYFDNLAESIKFLAENEDERLRMGRNAREMALTYDIERWKDSWRKIIPPAKEV